MKTIKISQERLHAILSHDPYSGSRDRPYDGQSHTDAGKRGATMVVGLSMRDIGDCIRKVQLDMPDLEDSIAFIQNVGCNIERMMGIFPNIDDDADSDDLPVYEIDPRAEPN